MNVSVSHSYIRSMAKIVNLVALTVVIVTSLSNVTSARSCCSNGRSIQSKSIDPLKEIMVSEIHGHSKRTEAKIQVEKNAQFDNVFNNIQHSTEITSTHDKMDASLPDEPATKGTGAGEEIKDRVSLTLSIAIGTASVILLIIMTVIIIKCLLAKSRAGLLMYHC